MEILSANALAALAAARPLAEDFGPDSPRPLLALSFSATKAKTLGMNPRFAHAALLVLIATAVIASFQAVGTLLVFALLVGPPATAALVTRTIPQMFVISAALAAFTVWLGLVLSYYWGTAGAATIALVAIALFFVTLAVRPLFRQKEATT